MLSGFVQSRKDHGMIFMQMYDQKMIHNVFDQRMVFCWLDYISVYNLFNH